MSGAPIGPNSNTPGNAGTTAPGSDEAQVCEAQPEPIRRLSHTEYLNTLRDLFPTIEVPAIELVVDGSVGNFSNNAGALNPSALLLEQYWDASRAVVEALEPTLDTYLSCDSAQGITCAERFISEFGRRAFRRPLASEEVAQFRALFEKAPGSSDFHVGMQLTIQALLASPAFLYRPEFGVTQAGLDKAHDLTDFELASRLSYLLWATMPDAALLDAAEAGQLHTAEQVETEVRRMLADDRAREGVLTFHREWLKLAQVDRVLKRPEDGYDTQLRAEIKESFDRFVWDTLFVNGGSVKELLTATAFPASARVAELFGADVPEGTWETVNVDGSQRAGLLTHPAFLAAHGYGGYPSPVLRGVYVMDRILCSPPSPPPAGVNIQLPSMDGTGSGPAVTNRDAYSEITKAQLCQGCHATINPLGFAFENFDTMGRYRDTDNGMPVDASGSSLGYEFANAVELAHELAESEDFQRCVVKKWSTYALGGGPLSQDQCFLDEVFESFAGRDFDVKELIVAITTHPKFLQIAEAP